MVALGPAVVAGGCGDVAPWAHGALGMAALVAHGPPPNNGEGQGAEGGGVGQFVFVLLVDSCSLVEGRLEVNGVAWIDGAG